MCWQKVAQMNDGLATDPPNFFSHEGMKGDQMNPHTPVIIADVGSPL